MWRDSSAGRSARTTTTSASAFATPTSSRSSRPRGSYERRVRPACRSRSRVRASWWVTVTAAGRPPSTFCTGRCARSPRAPTRSCPRAAGHRSTWSRWTTWPTRSARCTGCPAPRAGRFTSPPPTRRAASESCSTSPSGASSAAARRSSRRPCTAAPFIRWRRAWARSAAGAFCVRPRRTCRTSRWACAMTTRAPERRSARRSRPRRCTRTSTASSTTRSSRGGGLDRSAGPLP